MRRWLRWGLLLLPAVGVGGLLVAASGVIPIEASSGHWAITDWFLHFAMRRSVITHTLGSDPPALSEPWLVLKGAGHYEIGCRPCHGSPGLPQPRVARAMTPHAPDLTKAVTEWQPQQLFYIVKHGVKFTGMPAWPSQQRDDEVRAVVAFLLELPQLDRDKYRRLVHGDEVAARAAAPIADLVPPSAVRVAAERCDLCHGGDGNGRGNAAFPKLAGQRRDYLYRALEAYAGDRRHSGMMQPIAAGLSTEEREQLADFYSRLPASAVAGGDAAAIERGRAIARDGIASQGVPSCADCHGPGEHRRNPAYPNLAGQYADYLVLQLQLFQSRQRGGSAYAHLMERTASRLEAQQIRDVAQYYAAQVQAPAR
ncbi:MAG TPA: c-type cytochrome [Terriglobales bacterium]|nr:c-type cytochrome [Terriglobales bacterium]